MAVAARTRTLRWWPALSAGGGQTAPPGSEATTPGRARAAAHLLARAARLDMAEAVTRGGGAAGEGKAADRGQAGSLTC